MGSMTRIRSALLCAALVCSLGAASAHAAATKAVTFTVPFEDHTTRITGLGACDVNQTGVCSVRFGGATTIKGDLSTFVDYFGYFRGDTQRVFEGESWDPHTGSLKGCGSGSFVMHQTKINGDFSKFDPVTQSAPLYIVWEVLPGSGTGDFTGATGAGTGTGVFYYDLGNKGTYTGTINCRVPDAPLASDHSRPAKLDRAALGKAKAHRRHRARRRHHR